MNFVALKPKMTLFLTITSEILANHIFQILKVKS